MEEGRGEVDWAGREEQKRRGTERAEFKGCALSSA